jgi:sugar/nucleoside kinase (ribokinase family)
MSARVLVAGDANLDLVLRGDVRPRFGQAEQYLSDASLVLGSSAGICASGLARLGVTVSLVARVGDDLFGERTRSLLVANGVDVSEVVAVSGPTGLSVILSDGDRAIFTLPGAMVTLNTDDVWQAIVRSRATHLHLASFFLLPGIVVHAYDLLARARRAGLTTSLDPNWDPEERWGGVAKCLPDLDLLLPNAAEAVELAATLGEPVADPLDAARRLAARGPIVVVKDGVDGGFAVSGDDVVRAPSLPVELVDTTGAGDSFDAGFLAAWLEARPLAECVAWAAAAGSISVTGAGGTGRQADRAELEAALAGRS